MSLKAKGVIEIPDSAETSFDHGAFEPKSRRIFVAHTFSRKRRQDLGRWLRRRSSLTDLIEGVFPIAGAVN